MLKRSSSSTTEACPEPRSIFAEGLFAGEGEGAPNPNKSPSLSSPNREEVEKVAEGVVGVFGDEVEEDVLINVTLMVIWIVNDIVFECR